MKVIDKINNSGLFAQSAYSADIATRDSHGNTITATYLTAHQSLDGYATEDWVEEQGYLTAHQDISNKLDSTAFSTVSGSFLTAHQNIPASGNWNNTYETVSSHSAQWEVGGTVYEKEETTYNKGPDTLSSNTINVDNTDNTISIPNEITYSPSTVISIDNTSYFGEQPCDKVKITNNGAHFPYVTAPSGVGPRIEINNGGLYSYANSSTDDAAVLMAGSVYQTKSGKQHELANKLDTSSFSDVSGTFLTAHQDISNKVNRSELSTSGNWNSTYTTVSTNSAQWGQGGTIYEKEETSYNRGPDTLSSNTINVDNENNTISIPNDLTYSPSTVISIDNTSYFGSLPNDKIKISTTGIHIPYVTAPSGSGPNVDLRDGGIFSKPNYNENEISAVIINGRVYQYTSDGKEHELANKLDTSSFSDVSGNWQDTYNTVSSNSAQWGQGGGGQTYSGISPIVVNNTDYTISADAKTLVAGEGVEINETTTSVEISVTGGGSEYTAGTNIDITNNIISGRDWTPEFNEVYDVIGDVETLLHSL